MIFCKHSFTSMQHKKLFHITSTQLNLMQFFDDNKAWGENEVKHGRAWTKEELRIKSSSDLHKLWYILLKERNMLMTMEHEYKRLNRLFMSPERADKVQISMNNLEEIIKERNNAYYEIEAGESVYVHEREEINTQLGVKVVYRTQEYFATKEKNYDWRVKRRYLGSNSISKFLRLYREKILLGKTREKNLNRNKVVNLMKRFPETNIQLLRKMFPGVDVDNILKRDMARGHYVRE